MSMNYRLIDEDECRMCVMRMDIVRIGEDGWTNMHAFSRYEYFPDSWMPYPHGEECYKMHKLEEFLANMIEANNIFDP